jgi:pSer/pThr/pTyr-binding forkhead associated (FHA) protein
MVLDDSSVSRVHASIIRTANALYIEDMGSRNGLTVNDVPVKDKVELKNGDKIKIGHQIIYISALNESSKMKIDAKNTMGITICKNCGHWMSHEDEFCSKCGAPRKNRPETVSSKKPSTENILSGQMIASLIQKAISKNKYEEAQTMISSQIDSTLKKEHLGTPVTEKELEALTCVIIEMAVATSNPETISNLFDFYTSMKKLMPRKSVELLYDSIKKTKYRACSKMARYLTTMNEMSADFNPGEKFIYRRIEGLAGLCN